jgi:hypothetical protein
MEKKVKFKRRLDVRNKEIDNFNYTQRREEAVKELLKYHRKIL